MKPNDVDQEVREDLEKALSWAKTHLFIKTKRVGYLFQIHGDRNDGKVFCTIELPEWSGDFWGGPADTGSEAIVNAVCEFLEQET